jgi:hypothetical protein
MKYKVHKIPFSTGGFVLHGIYRGERRLSGWYTEDGTLIDSERTVSDREAGYPTSKADRDRLRRVGSCYTKVS